MLVYKDAIPATMKPVLAAPEVQHATSGVPKNEPAL